MKIIEDRHARQSTIIVIQLPVARCLDVIGGAIPESRTVVILDRSVHTTHPIELKGESQ